MQEVRITRRPGSKQGHTHYHQGPGSYTVLPGTRVIDIVTRNQGHTHCHQEAGSYTVTHTVTRKQGHTHCHQEPGSHTHCHQQSTSRKSLSFSSSTPRSWAPCSFCLWLFAGSFTHGQWHSLYLAFMFTNTSPFTRPALTFRGNNMISIA